MRSVVITGVSTGIGYATAADLCRRGYRVFGSVRNEGHADPLLREWGALFTPLVFDVTDADAVKAAAALVKNATGNDGLCGLVSGDGLLNPRT